LNIGANYLSHLNPEIGALKCLTTLELNDNVLEDIPTEISMLSSLQVLNLEGPL
jgi:Leucine-rich repeat (LRR) protein